MSKTHMRRDVVKLVAGLGFAGLAGCLGGEDPADADAGTTPTPTPAATPTPTATPDSTATPDETPDGQAAVTAWAQVYGDARNTGFTAASGPASGTVRWTKRPGNTTETPPVVWGNQLFVSSGKTLYALRVADGETVWSRTFGGEITHAVACTDGTLLVPTNRVEAVAADSGQSKWTSSTGGGPVTDLTVDDGVAYFGAADSKVYGLSVADGSQVARSALFSFGGIQTPATDGRYVYVAASDSVVGLKRSGSQIWRRDTDGPVQVPPMVDGDTVYVGTGSGTLYALNRTTGAVTWTTDLGGAVSAPPTIGAAGLYVVSGATLYRIEPGTGRIEWQERVANSSLTAPTQTADTLYLGSADRVYALNPTNGAELWSTKTSHSVVGGPVVAGDSLYVNTTAGTVVAFA